MPSEMQMVTPKPHDSRFAPVRPDIFRTGHPRIEALPEYGTSAALAYRVTGNYSECQRQAA